MGYTYTMGLFNMNLKFDKGQKIDLILIIVSAISIIASFILSISYLSWIAVILCGVPIFKECVEGFITELDIKADLLVTLAIIASIVIGEVFILASLAGMIPLLPGGLGAVDGIMIIFYSAAGISSSIAAAATVIERLISFWMPTILGMVILPYYGSSALDRISFNSDDDESGDD